MSVYRRVDGGDFHIDREFLIDGELLRFKAWAYTDHEREARNREDMLVEMHRAGSFSLLRALKGGEITVLDLWAAKRENRLYIPDALREITDRRNLWDVLEECIAKGTAGAKTKERYTTSLTKLRKQGTLGARATIKTLATIHWPELQKQWGGSPADWNHMVRMVSHCLSIYYGDVYAPQRRAIVKLIPKAREPRSRLRLLSLETFRKAVAKAPAVYRDIYWTLLLTGLRAGEGGEYFSTKPQHLDASAHLLHVPGTKTEGSAFSIAVHPDYWHHVASAVPAPRQYKAVAKEWRKATKKACGRALRLHDIRHLCIGLALDGGASLPDAQAHARHEDPTMTMDYARVESSRRAATAIRDQLKESAS